MRCCDYCCEWCGQHEVTASLLAEHIERRCPLLPSEVRAA